MKQIIIFAFLVISIVLVNDAKAQTIMDQEAKATEASEASKARDDGPSFLDIVEFVNKGLDLAINQHNSIAEASKTQYFKLLEGFLDEIEYYEIAKLASEGNPSAAYRLALLLDYKILNPAHQNFVLENDKLIHNLYIIAAKGGITSANERLTVHLKTHGLDGGTFIDPMTRLHHHLKAFEGFEHSRSAEVMAAAFEKQYNSMSSVDKNSCDGKRLLSMMARLKDDHKGAIRILKGCDSADQLNSKIDLVSVQLNYSQLTKSESKRLKEQKEGCILLRDYIKVLLDADPDEMSYERNKAVECMNLLIQYTNDNEEKERLQKLIFTEAENGTAIASALAYKSFLHGSITTSEELEQAQYYYSLYSKVLIPEVGSNLFNIMMYPGKALDREFYDLVVDSNNLESTLPHTKSIKIDDLKAMIDTLSRPVVVFAFDPGGEKGMSSLTALARLNNILNEPLYNHILIAYHLKESPETNLHRNQQLLAIAGLSGLHYDANKYDKSTLAELHEMFAETTTRNGGILVYRADKSSKPFFLWLDQREETLGRELRQ